MPDYVAPSATTAQKSQGGQHVRQFTNDSVGSASFISGGASATTVTFVVVPISGTYSIQLLYGYQTAAANTGSMGNIRVQVQNITVTSLTMIPANNTLQTATMILTALQGQSISLNIISAEPAGNFIVGTIIATQLG